MPCFFLRGKGPSRAIAVGTGSQIAVRHGVLHGGGDPNDMTSRSRQNTSFFDGPEPYARSAFRSRSSSIIFWRCSWTSNPLPQFFVLGVVLGRSHGTLT